jgi:hypothetical protein
VAKALQSLVDLVGRIDHLRHVTGLAVLYPLFVFVLVCVLLAAVIQLVVPSFDWLTRPHFGPLAALADWPWTVPILAIVLPVCAVVVVGAWWFRSGHISGARSVPLSAGGWLPWTRRVRYWTQATLLADMLRLLVERGLPLDQSLLLAADASGCESFRTAARIAAQRLGRGDVAVPPAAAANSSAAGLPGGADLPALVRLALQNAHDRRLFVATLRQAGETYCDRAERAAQWHVEYLPTLLVVVIGGTLTIFFTVLILWPYTSMLYEIAGGGWR